MKIAQIAPLVERVPPKKYGGTERVVYALTEELVKRGHDVTLFASGDSITSAKLISVYPLALREAKVGELYGTNLVTMTSIGYAYQRASDFDIIHDHMGCISLPTANISKTPVVSTYHGPINPEVRRIYNTLRNPSVVTISHSQAKTAQGLNLIGTVYNGLEMEDYLFSATHDSYLLYVGRISQEKGVHLAIEVAQYLNLPLIIAAKLDYSFEDDVEYFKKQIEPKLSDKIKWIGEVDEAERNKLMSKAMALIHAVTWQEPFGLTMIEAMACGCPVVAFGLGSIPEIVVSGETGFVVDDIWEMIEGIANINLIDRNYCRKYALKFFNAKRMTTEYEQIYREILSRKQDKKSNFISIRPLPF